MESQKDRIKNALLSGQHITRIEALQQYGVSRLAARIVELDNELKIAKGWRKIPTRFDNSSTKIREYWLESGDL